jgi:hypothetical protein
LKIRSESLITGTVCRKENIKIKIFLDDLTWAFLARIMLSVFLLLEMHLGSSTPPGSYKTWV